MEKTEDNFEDIRKMSEESLGKIWNNEKDEIWNDCLDLNTIKEVENARKRIEEGNFLTEEEARKKLGF